MGITRETGDGSSRRWVNSPVDHRALYVQLRSVPVDDTLWTRPVLYMLFSVRYPLLPNLTRLNFDSTSSHMSTMYISGPNFFMEHGLNTSSKLSREHSARESIFLIMHPVNFIFHQDNPALRMVCLSLSSFSFGDSDPNSRSNRGY
jgi:hypothetical protein